MDLISLASKRLQWASDRQRVISENIANADVVGYRAQEIEGFDSYLKRAESASTPPPAKVSEVQGVSRAAISGNTVVLEEQLIEANSAKGQYRIATSLYRKAHEMIAAVVTAR